MVMRPRDSRGTYARPNVRRVRDVMVAKTKIPKRRIRIPSGIAYRLRKRDSPILGLPWWYMDVMDKTTKEVLETFEVGEPVEYARFELPDGRYPIFWIGAFQERNNKGWIIGHLVDHPDELQVQFHEIEKLPPLVRLAAEAAR